MRRLRPTRFWEQLPLEVQKQIVAKETEGVCDRRLCNAAREAGMGGRINTVMQTCFFAISGVLPREQAIAKIKKAIEKTYAKKGAEMVRKNFAAVDGTLAHLHELHDSRRCAFNGKPMPADRADRGARIS